MRTSVLILWLYALLSLKLLGQYELDGNFDLTFDNSYGFNHLTIDTISNPKNIWQVGAPQKDIFTTAYSYPNVIITDTIDYYPISDTSVFLITNVALGYGFDWPHTVVFAAWYNVNSDTLTDYGKIEFSHDNGNTWIDIFNNEYWFLFESSDKPILTGNSNGWKNFWVNIAVLGEIFDINYGDTVLYRFTFISDSIQTNKSGLMFDNLHFEDWMSSEITEQGYELIQSTCYPNPGGTQLTIKFDNINNLYYELEVYDSSGKQIYQLTNLKTQEINLDISKLDNGLFYYRLQEKNGNKITIGRFIKN